MPAPRRPVALLVLVLAAALPLAALPGSAAAAAKPVVCKAGTGKLTINGKARCVKLAALVPNAAAAPSAYARWTRVAIDRGLGQAFEQRFVKQRLRGKVGARAKATLAALRARIVPLGAALDAAAGVQSKRVVPGSRGLLAVTTTVSPVTTTVTPSGATVTGSISTRDAANGTTGTLDVTGRVRQDAAGGKDPGAELELGMTIKTDSGKSWRTEIAIPMNLTADLAERCPSATGVVRRKGGFSLRRTTREAKTMVGLDYVNETTSVTAKTSFTGQVDADAVLSSIAYDVKVDIDYAHASSILRGLIRGNTQIKMSVTAKGTLNGASGAVASGSVAIDGSGRVLGQSSAETKADLAKELADPAFRAKMEELVASFLKTNFEALKDAETHWQTPNACAKLDLSPTTATLAADETKAVDGAIAAESGEVTNGKWTAKTVARGTVTTLPGVSTAAQRIALTMKGVADDGSGKAVDVTLRATSPAGIAERQWTADAAASTLYFRVVAASGSQSADGTLASTSGCSYASVTSGPWTYAFAATTGAPDGSVEIEDRFLFGSVRASGVSVAPSLVQTVTCPMGGGATNNRTAITYDGKFGPVVSFAETTGDPSTVQVTWSILSPPPLLDVEMVGADCRPEGTPLSPAWRTTVPLATMRGTAPFTLTHSTPWTVDKTNVVGHTTCTGSTTQSVTLQRVAANGSPLS